MTKVTQKQVGQRLAQLRKEAGLTQAQVAEHLDVSNETVSRLERGISWPDFAVLCTLACLYRVHLADLLAVFPDDEEGARRAAIREVVTLLETQPNDNVALALRLLRTVLEARTPAGQ